MSVLLLQITGDTYCRRAVPRLFGLSSSCPFPTTCLIPHASHEKSGQCSCRKAVAKLIRKAPFFWLVASRLGSGSNVVKLQRYGINQLKMLIIKQRREEGLRSRGTTSTHFRSLCRSFRSVVIAFGDRSVLRTLT